MSAGFESTVILSLIHISSPTYSSSTSSTSSSSLKSGLLNALHFCSKQRLVLETPSLSMRLRPKRYLIVLYQSFLLFFQFCLFRSEVLLSDFVTGLVLVLKSLGVFT